MQGNTVLVVEHDEEAIREADYVFDMGPGAGVHGGQVVSHGTPAEVAADPASLTGQYLSGAREIAVPKTRRKGNGKKLTVVGRHRQQPARTSPPSFRWARSSASPASRAAASPR